MKRHAPLFVSMLTPGSRARQLETPDIALELNPSYLVSR